MTTQERSLPDPPLLLSLLSLWTSAMLGSRIRFFSRFVFAYQARRGRVIITHILFFSDKNAPLSPPTSLLAAALRKIPQQLMSVFIPTDDPTRLASLVFPMYR